MKMTFEEAVKLNTAPHRGGAAYGFNLWHSMLHDVATSLFYWKCNGKLPYRDLLRIEEYLYKGQPFGIFKVKVRIGKAIVKSGYRVLPSTKTRAQHIRISKSVLYHKPNDWIYTGYENGIECVMFDTCAWSMPISIASKYAEILTNLDALYAQQIEKLSLPVIFRTTNSSKNDLIKIMKEGAVNSAFSIVEGANVDTDNIFDPSPQFHLDKVRTERVEMMNEFIGTLGIAPTIRETSQYVNKIEIGKSSIANKTLGAALYRSRVCFCDSVNRVFPEIGLSFESNVTYDLGEGGYKNESIGSAGYAEQ
jgi:hypothetical protein|uniref:Portal protein n=2 Tax=unclassified Caudoviricetes TaxID=2788787 RepID=A0A8S5U2P5_9CAUD|nr:MAG TPA: portal protein [Podoviridae sp. cte242]DAF88714.1 MAG TPA: portal protein [Podoviridae sp. ctCDM29]